jgi:serine/threonine protein kinase
MSNLENRELVIMQTIQKIDDSFHSGHEHIVGLLDSFFHNGPNGKHLCLVTELCGLPVSAVFEQCPERRIDGQLARQVSLQLLKATHYLHTIGIAHGGMF